jgi:hypothetical protein
MAGTEILIYYPNFYKSQVYKGCEANKLRIKQGACQKNIMNELNKWKVNYISTLKKLQ